MSEQPPQSPGSEEPKVKVSDRRRFNPEGDARDPSDIDTKDEPSPPHVAQNPAHEAGPSGASGTEREDAGRGRSPLPPASFDLLVVSLAMQAQMELQSPEGAPDLEMARHSIDLLGVLQQKTRGNLTLEEQRLLDNTVTELRFRYVQAVSEINEKAKS
jgi:hypothetical protein